MRKAKSKTVKTNGRPYNSPNISEGMKKWWKERKRREAASRYSATDEISSRVGDGSTKKQAVKALKGPSIHSRQLHAVRSALEELLGQIKTWQNTP